MVFGLSIQCRLVELATIRSYRTEVHMRRKMVVTLYVTIAFLLVVAAFVIGSLLVEQNSMRGFP